MNGQLTISLYDLNFFSYHGWHEEEKLTGNNFLINCLIYMAAPPMVSSISQTINYVSAFEIIKSEMEKPRQLLETLAMEIVEKLHQEHPSINRIEFHIRKTQPPIANFLGSVGVSYSKDFK